MRTAPNIADTLQPGPRPTIIVVDDSEICRDIAAYLLEDMGYEVISVGDPFALADALRASRPALVLVDVNMPKVGGGELLELVKVDGALNCPFVLHSDRPEEELAGLASRYGASGFIRKTADPDKLRTEVERFLYAGSKPGALRRP